MVLKPAHLLRTEAAAKGPAPAPRDKARQTGTVTDGARYGSLWLSFIYGPSSEITDGFQAIESWFTEVSKTCCSLYG